MEAKRISYGATAGAVSEGSRVAREGKGNAAGQGENGVCLSLLRLTAGCLEGFASIEGALD